MDGANLEATVRECLDGRPGAWEALVNAYAKRVFNLAYQFSGSYQEAEDQTQEIFLKLYGALPKFDFQRSFTAWLLTLAKNHLIDAYRRTKWERKQRDDFDERTAAGPLAGDPQDALEREESRRLVWTSLNDLSPDMRMAVILRDLQGRSYEEIAAVLDLPLGTVKSRVNRARLALARVVEEKRVG
jgi:RNA polymerase sigma-70 factor (ECF subfamily)